MRWWLNWRGIHMIIGLVDGAGGRARLEMLKTRTIGVTREVSVTTVFAAVTGRMRVQSEGAARGLISMDTLTVETLRSRLLLRRP